MLCNPRNLTGRTRKPFRASTSRGLRRGLTDVKLALLVLLLESRATLLKYCRFVEAHDLHLVVDEVYGLSVFSASSSSN